MKRPFDEAFFEEEEREGFLITSKMKHAWAANLLVLEDVLSVAKNHGITVFAAFGTLLGAVRHRGFVPWDDDLDVFVKREEYIALMRYLEQELPDYYHVYSSVTAETNTQPQGAVVNRLFPDLGSEMDRLITERFCGCPYSTGIDVFPLDRVPADPEEKEFHSLLYGAVYDTAQRYDEYEAKGELAEKLQRIRETTGQPLNSEEPMEKQLWRLADRIAMMYAGEPGPELACMKLTAMAGDAGYYPAEWFAFAVELPFENILMPAPVGMLHFLDKNYGPSYMAPVKFAAGHDYPFYRRQDEYMEGQKPKH